MGPSKSKSLTPEPEKTGVEPNQVQAEQELVVLPRDENKTYASMGETLEGLMATRIQGATIAILSSHEKASEERFKNVDNERKQALDDLKKMTRAYYDERDLVTKCSERLKIGYRSSIAQNIMITIGAAVLGAGIADTSSSQDKILGRILLALGSLLLLVGWILAIVDHAKNKQL